MQTDQNSTAATAQARPKQRHKGPPKRPQEAIVAQAYAATGSVRRTGLLTGYSKSAVHDILKRSPSALADAKNTMAAKDLALAERAAEACSANLHRELRPASLAVISGIFQDKAETLTRQPAAPLVHISILGELATAISRLSETQPVVCADSALSEKHTCTG